MGMEQPTTSSDSSGAADGSNGGRQERRAGWRRAGLAAALAGLLVGLIALAILNVGPLLNVGPTLAPRQASVGVITIPATVINERSARLVGRHLDYARRDDSIRAVVISLSSPGGGAAASEWLYLETRRLREEKPVVMVTNGIAASGGYMMAMGGSYVYAQPSSLVGNVGVIVGGIGTLPGLPSESTVGTGPQKRSGADRQQWIGMLNNLHNSFVGLVLAERGDRLRLTRKEVAEGRLYSGVEAVEYGLVDAIGSDGQAIAKAAELAGLSQYDVTDVNRQLIEEALRRLRSELAPLPSELAPLPSGMEAVSSVPPTGAGLGGGYGLLPSLLRESAPGETPPGFPAGGERPAFYYYYPGDGWQEPPAKYASNGEATD